MCTKLLRKQYVSKLFIRTLKDLKNNLHSYTLKIKEKTNRLEKDFEPGMETRNPRK